MRRDVVGHRRVAVLGEPYLYLGVVVVVVVVAVVLRRPFSDILSRDTYMQYSVVWKMIDSMHKIQMASKESAFQRPLSDNTLQRNVRKCPTRT